MLEFTDGERPFDAEILSARFSSTVDPWLNPVYPLAPGTVAEPEITWTFGLPSAGRDVQAGVVYPCIMYQENLTGDGIRLQASHFDIESGVPSTLYQESGNTWAAVALTLLLEVFTYQQLSRLCGSAYHSVQQ